MADHLRERFLAALSAALNECSDLDLAEAWASYHRRTAFYKTHLVPDLSARLGLRFASERLLIDYAMLHETEDVPLVFIESENDSFDAWREVGKLAAVRTPLRVLLSVVAWTPEPGVWPVRVGQRDASLAQWRAVAAAHAAAYGSAGGAFIAVVGEWRNDQSLAFYAHGIDPQSQHLLPDEPGIIWHRRMTVSQEEAVRLKGL